MKSHVIAFRLYEDNPDEAQALTLLNEAASNGWSTRKAIVFALLQAGNLGRPPEDHTADELRAALVEARSSLQEARSLVEALRTVGVVPAQHDGQAAAGASPDEDRPVSDTFQAAIKRAARSGRRLE
jgi:hypothetical protein